MIIVMMVHHHHHDHHHHHHHRAINYQNDSAKIATATRTASTEMTVPNTPPLSPSVLRLLPLHFRLSILLMMNTA
jgi:hypothetical protein